LREYEDDYLDGIEQKHAGDEHGEDLLGEAGHILDDVHSLKRQNGEREDEHPEGHPHPHRQVLDAEHPAEVEEHLLEDEEGAGGAVDHERLAAEQARDDAVERRGHEHFAHAEGSRRLGG